MIQDFAKYRAQGAYHWRSASDSPWAHRDLLGAARYALVLKTVLGLTRQGATGLDVGTGDGVLLFEAARRGLSLMGVEGLLEGAQLARQMLRARGLAGRIAVADATGLPLPDGRLDFVTCIEVIEHVPCCEELVAELHRVLKPSGVLVLTTPLRRPDRPTRDPYHFREFTRDELRELLATCFGDVDVAYLTPPWLMRFHTHPTPIPALSRLVRLLVRLLALGGVNLFEKLGRSQKDGDGLIAVARLPRAETI